MAVEAGGQAVEAVSFAGAVAIDEGKAAFHELNQAVFNNKTAWTNVTKDGRTVKGFDLIRDGVSTKLKLPPNAWGAFVVIVMCGWRKEDFAHRLIVFFCPVIFSLIVACAIQLIFIREVANFMNYNKLVCPAEATPTGAALVWACIFVYIGNIVFRDLDESVSIFYYQQKFPTRRKGDTSRGGMEVDDKGVPVSTISWTARLVITVTLLTKTAIGIALAHYGVGFIVQSTTSKDALMTAVKLLFILDVDELAYRLAGSAALRTVLEDAPAVRMFSGKESPVSMVLILYVKMASTFFITFLLRWVWCRSSLSVDGLAWVNVAFVVAGGVAGIVCSGCYVGCCGCIWRMLRKATATTPAATAPNASPADAGNP